MASASCLVALNSRSQWDGWPVKARPKARLYIRHLAHKQNASCILFGFLSKRATLHSTSRQTFCLQNVWAQTFCIFRTKCSAKRLEPNNSHRPNVLHKRLAPWRSRGTVLALGLAPRAPACLVGFRRTPQARGRSGVHTGTALEILVGRTTTRTAQCSHLDASPHPHCASRCDQSGFSRNLTARLHPCSHCALARVAL